MKKEYTMKCQICGEKVTKSEIKYGDAFKSKSDDKYYHTDCVDDKSRAETDAYHRA